MTLKSSRRDSPSSIVPLRANSLYLPVNYRNNSNALEEMVDAKPTTKTNTTGLSTVVKKSMLELDVEITSVFNQHAPTSPLNPPKSPQQMEEDTTFSVTVEEDTTFSGTSDSGGTIETLDGSSVNQLKLIEEMMIIPDLTRSWKDDKPSPPRRRRKKKSSWKRGDGLERAVSRAILQTASAGASDAHFLVDSSGKDDTDCKTAQFILSDLVQDSQEEPQIGSQTNSSKLSEAPFVKEPCATQNTAAPSLRLNTNQEDNGPVSAGAPDPDVQAFIQSVDVSTENKQRAKLEDKKETEIEAPPEFPTVESFDSLSWKDTGPTGATDQTKDATESDSKPGPDSHRNTALNDSSVSKVEESAILSAILKEDPPAGRTSLKEDPPSGPTIEKIINDPQEPKKQEVLFKTNFEDWTPFDASHFDSSPFMGIRNEVARDSNGFPVTPHKQTSTVPKLKPPSPIPASPRRKIFLRPSGSSVKTMSPIRKHGRSGQLSRSFKIPPSPASVFDFRNSGHKQDMGGRSGAAQAHHQKVSPRDQRTKHHANDVF